VDLIFYAVHKAYLPSHPFLGAEVRNVDFPVRGGRFVIRASPLPFLRALSCRTVLHRFRCSISCGSDQSRRSFFPSGVLLSFCPFFPDGCSVRLFISRPSCASRDFFLMPRPVTHPLVHRPCPLFRTPEIKCFPPFPPSSGLVAPDNFLLKCLAGKPFTSPNFSPPFNSPPI